MSSDEFTKEEIDRATKWKFKGLDDAARLMRKRPPGPKVVGRWDWHFWMFLVTTCLPCFGVYCMAMWVRAGLWEEHGKKEVGQSTQNPVSQESSSPNDIYSLQQELQKLKLLLLMQGKDRPALTLESWKRIFDEKKRREETKSAPEKKTETPFSERVWNRVKSWLPFYVEPFYQRRDGPPLKTDFTAIMRSDKSKS